MREGGGNFCRDELGRQEPCGETVWITCMEEKEPEISHLSAEPTWLCLPLHKDKWLQQFAKLMLTLLMLLYWDLADVLYSWNTIKRLIQCFIIADKTAPQQQHSSLDCLMQQQHKHTLFPPTIQKVCCSEWPAYLLSSALADVECTKCLPVIEVLRATSLYVALMWNYSEY